MTKLATKKPQKGFSAAPSKLRKIIELVNFVGPEDELLPIDYRPPKLPALDAGRIEVNEFDQKNTEFRKTIHRVLTDRLKRLPRRFREYVWEPAFPAESVKRYEDVRIWRENLQKIAIAGPWLLLTLNSALYIYRDETGKKIIRPDRFRAALDEDGVEIDCIRACGVCSRIYYEDRLYYNKKEKKLTQPACQYHGQTFRSRRNYRPVKTDDVEAYLAEIPNWERTDVSVRKMALEIDATVRQTNLALDFLERKKKRADKR